MTAAVFCNTISGSILFEIKGLRIVSMPKQKSHKGLRKRVKLTASGKVKCKHAGSGHLMSSKNAKRRRRIAAYRILEGKIAQKFYKELVK